VLQIVMDDENPFYQKLAGTKAKGLRLLIQLKIAAE
jgi:hypothetical protein